MKRESSFPVDKLRPIYLPPSLWLITKVQMNRLSVAR